MADEASLKNKKQKMASVQTRSRLSDMTFEDYVKFTDQNPRVTTVSARDIQMENLEALRANILSGDITLELEATGLVRNILQINPDPPFQQFIEAGVLPYFVEFLNRDNPAIQAEAAKIIRLYVETTDHLNTLVQHGAVERLASLIPSPHLIIRRMVIYTLSIIAASSSEQRALVLQSQGLHFLLDQFEANSLDYMLMNAAEALASFCRGDPPLDSNMSSRVFHVLHRLVSLSRDIKVLGTACGILHDLTRGGNFEVHGDVAHDLFIKLIGLMNHASTRVFLPATLALANIVEHNEGTAEQMLVHQRLSRIGTLILDQDDKNIKTAACKLIRHISKDAEHSKQLMKHGMMTVLLYEYKASDADVKYEMAKAIISIIYSGTLDDLKPLGGSIIEALCDMLDQPILVQHPLKCLNKILGGAQKDLHEESSGQFLYYTRLLEKFGGVQKIQALQSFGDEAVVRAAQSIMYQYWPSHS